MEAGSLAVGIFTLASLFNNTVDCFEYVQLGRRFGTNFQTSLLKLDNARLRLSRWGQSVGLSGDVGKAQSLPAAALPTQDVVKAERVLGQILDLFANAEQVAIKFKSCRQPDDSNLTVLDAHTDMDSVGRSLHEKMRGISITRQNEAPLRQKVKWALYEEKPFKRLIEDIIDLINDLVQVFPAVQQAQQRLCELEVSELGAKENLAALRNIAASQDKDLEAAISTALKLHSSEAPAFNNYDSKIGQQIGISNVYGNQNFSF